MKYKCLDCYSVKSENQQALDSWGPMGDVGGDFEPLFGADELVCHRCGGQLVPARKKVYDSHAKRQQERRETNRRVKEQQRVHRLADKLFARYLKKVYTHLEYGELDDDFDVFRGFDKTYPDFAYDYKNASWGTKLVEKRLEMKK